MEITPSQEARSELLSWLNAQLPENVPPLKKVEQCGSGAPYLILLPYLLPAEYQRLTQNSRVKVKATHEFDMISNWKVLQETLQKNNISKPPAMDDPTKLIKGNFQANLSLLQWFKGFADRVMLGENRDSTAESKPSHLGHLTSTTEGPLSTTARRGKTPPSGATGSTTLMSSVRAGRSSPCGGTGSGPLSSSLGSGAVPPSTTAQRGSKSQPSTTTTMSSTARAFKPMNQRESEMIAMVNNNNTPPNTTSHSNTNTASFRSAHSPPPSSLTEGARSSASVSSAAAGSNINANTNAGKSTGVPSTAGGGSRFSGAGPKLSSAAGANAEAGLLSSASSRGQNSSSFATRSKTPRGPRTTGSDPAPRTSTPPPPTVADDDVVEPGIHYSIMAAPQKGGVGETRTPVRAGAGTRGSGGRSSSANAGTGRTSMPARGGGDASDVRHTAPKRSAAAVGSSLVGNGSGTFSATSRRAGATTTTTARSRTPPAGTTTSKTTHTSTAQGLTINTVGGSSAMPSRRTSTPTSGAAPRRAAAGDRGNETTLSSNPTTTTRTTNASAAPMRGGGQVERLTRRPLDPLQGTGVSSPRGPQAHPPGVDLEDIEAVEEVLAQTSTERQFYYDKLRMIERLVVNVAAKDLRGTDVAAVALARSIRDVLYATN